MEQNTKEIPFQEILDALLDDSRILNPQYLYHLSDIEGDDLTKLAHHWPTISPRRRRALLEDMEDLLEMDYLLSFETISRLALTDPDPQIRLPATRILWESESKELIPTFYESCLADPDADVRACMAAALGRFIYLGEVEELSEQLLRELEERLLAIVNGTDETHVRRRALESLGYSSRDEIPDLIIKAFNHGDELWLSTALFAMGRSADPRWSRYVLDEIGHPSPSVRLEAVRAAGELEVSDAVPGLIELLQDESEDVRQAAIWSLSQIGGEGVSDALEELLEESDESEDSDLIDFIELALDNLVFTEDRSMFTLFDFDEDILEVPKEEDNSEASVD
jgi:HEAT repeat protein